MRLWLVSLVLVVGCSSCFRKHGQEAREVVIRELSARYSRSFTVENVHAIMYSDAIEMDVLARLNADGSGPMVRSHAWTTLENDVRVLGGESFGAELIARELAVEVASALRDARPSDARPSDAPALSVCVFGLLGNETSLERLRAELGTDANRVRLRVLQPALSTSDNDEADAQTEAQTETDPARGIDVEAEVDAVFQTITNVDESVRPRSVEWYFLSGPIPEALKDTICTDTLEVSSPLWNLIRPAPHVRFSMLPRNFARYRESKEVFLERARVIPRLRPRSKVE